MRIPPKLFRFQSPHGFAFLAATGQFSNMAIEMTKVGETTGSLAEMLSSVADPTDVIMSPDAGAYRYHGDWAGIVANIFGAGLALVLSKPITKLTVVPFSYLAPFMILIITFASYQASYSWGDLIALLLVGILGWLMKQFGWPRPAALIGFVLAGNLEQYLFISVQRYGLGWLTRPGVIIMAIIIIASLSASIVYQKKFKTAGRTAAKE